MERRNKPHLYDVYTHYPAEQHNNLKTNFKKKKVSFSDLNYFVATFEKSFSLM